MSYPIFVNLAGRRCVVVGGGAVASRRIEGLLASGGDVRIVAPSTSPAIAALATDGSLTWVKCPYDARHIDDAFIVIAATNDPAVNIAVCRDADARRILACSAGEPGIGSFTVPATITRGELSIAVTTGGASPTLASVLSESLKVQFGPEWAQWTQMFARLRPQIQQIAGASRRQTAVGAVLADIGVIACIRSGDLDGAVREAQTCISLLPD